jgi:hypothetical protein
MIASSGVTINGQSFDSGGILPDRYNSISTPVITVPKTTIPGVNTIKIIDPAFDNTGAAHDHSHPTPKEPVDSGSTL